MTLAQNVENAIEKVNLGLYESASVLLDQAFHLCDSDELIEEYWPILASLISTLAMSGQSDKMYALVLKLQAGKNTRNIDVRLATQLATFYSLLDSGANGKVIDVTLKELQMLDRQHGGRYRAGVLAAEGILLFQCGDLGSALEKFQRAWSHSETLGGFCPQQSICEILRISLGLRDAELAEAWMSALANVPAESLCCSVRSGVARAEAALVKELFWSTDSSRKLLDLLRRIECPDLIVRGCSAIVRYTYAQNDLSTDDRIDLAMDALSVAGKVCPSAPYAFDRLIAQIDSLLCAKAIRSGMKVMFEYSAIGVLLSIREIGGSSTVWRSLPVVVEPGTDCFKDAMRLATALDDRFGSSSFKSVVNNRMAFIVR